MSNRKKHSTKSSSPKSILAIAELLQKVTYVIDIFENQDEYDRNESYSSGSGVAINSTGNLITAAHVITGRNSVESKGLTGQEIILARTENLPLMQYRIVKCGIQIHMEVLREPLSVDLAYLSPLTPRENAPFVRVKRDFSPIGTPVLMAGYPDEVEPPLSFNRYINYQHNPFTAPEHQTARKIRAMRQQLMVKSGILGYAQKAAFNGDDGSELLALTAYYVDNGMHSGASGGPVLNMQGELIGTINKRAVTTISNEELLDPNLNIPSGSTLAISSSTIIDFLENNSF